MSRPRSKRPQIYDKIIDAAERLFSMYGIEGVSLRQIAAEAGSANNYVVQYHFGDKKNLIRAIFERRLPELELHRAKLLAQAKRDGLLQDPRALVNVILRPLAELRDEKGRRRYASFLLSLVQFEGSFSIRTDVSDLAPMTDHVRNLLRLEVRHLSVPIFDHRFSLISTLFLSKIAEIDRREGSLGADAQDDAWISDTLDMAAAALLAPVAPEVLDALGGPRSEPNLPAGQRRRLEAG